MNFISSVTRTICYSFSSSSLVRCSSLLAFIHSFTSRLHVISSLSTSTFLERSFPTMHLICVFCDLYWRLYNGATLSSRELHMVWPQSQGPRYLDQQSHFPTAVGTSSTPLWWVILYSAPTLTLTLILRYVRDPSRPLARGLPSLVLFDLIESVEFEFWAASQVMYV